jgi:hypothetical protein
MVPRAPQWTLGKRNLGKLGFAAGVIDTLQIKNYVKNRLKLSNLFTQQKVTFTDSRLLQY